MITTGEEVEQVTEEVAETTETSTATKKASRKKKTQETKAEEPVTCMYIGPGIHGVIPENCIISGTKAERDKKLALALGKYPEISALVVPITELASKRKEVHQPGTLLHARYTALAKKTT